MGSVLLVPPSMPGPGARDAPGAQGFRIAGFVHDPAEGAALDEMARVAWLLARLSRAALGAQSQRSA